MMGLIEGTLITCIDRYEEINMDTSLEYIKMCRKAVDIHDRRPIPTERGVYTVSECCSTIEEYHANPYYIHKCSCCGEDIGLNGLEYVWLPRQDQLQEMIFEHAGYGLQSLCCALYEFSTSEEGHGFTIVGSMEQLQLGFLMKEQYSKKWNGSEWVFY